MCEITNRTKRIIGELTILICIVCVWVVKSEIIGIEDVKAGVLKQAVKANPDNAEAHRYLADYYMDSGSYEEAIGALRQVIRLNPDDSTAHSELGDAYWHCGRYEQSMAAYKQAMKLQLDNPYIHFQIAQAYLKMGDKDSALEQYEILKDMDEELAKQLFVLIPK